MCIRDSTSTLQGLGAYPGDDPQFLGMLGMHGTYEANNAMHDCDLMINIGARFDDRITGKIDEFSPGSKKIHIDIDPSSINKNIQIDLALIGDVKVVLEKLISTVVYLGVLSSTMSILPVIRKCMIILCKSNSIIRYFPLLPKPTTFSPFNFPKSASEARCQIDFPPLISHPFMDLANPVLYESTSGNSGT